MRPVPRALRRFRGDSRSPGSPQTSAYRSTPATGRARAVHWNLAALGAFGPEGTASKTPPSTSTWSGAADEDANSSHRASTFVRPRSPRPAFSFVVALHGENRPLARVTVAHAPQRG
jgi:hypothetical protein